MASITAVSTCHCKDPCKAILKIRDFFSDINYVKLLPGMAYLSMLRQNKSYRDNCSFYFL